MRKLFYTASGISAMLGLLWQPVMADTLSLGAGVLVTPNPYRGHQDRVYPAPLIHYDSERFYVEGMGLGYYLWNEGANQLSVTAIYNPLHFRSGDSDNEQMKQLNSRHSTVMGGIRYQYQDTWGTLRGVMTGDMLDNSNGLSGDAAYLYPIDSGRLKLTPGLGTVWDSEKQNRYYYGVSGSESRRSGLRSYRPNDSWSPYAELSLNYAMTPALHATASGRYTRLGREITDSPMVNKTYVASMLAGIAYQF